MTWLRPKTSAAVPRAAGVPERSPGPWTLGDGVCVIGADGRRITSMCPGERSDTSPNTRLVLAAPDLLEALRGFDLRPCVLERDRTAPGDPMLCVRHAHRAPCPHERARHAVAKAEGRAP